MTREEAYAKEREWRTTAIRCRRHARDPSTTLANAWEKASDLAHREANRFRQLADSFNPE